MNKVPSAFVRRDDDWFFEYDTPIMFESFVSLLNNRLPVIEHSEPIEFDKYGGKITIKARNNTAHVFNFDSVVAIETREIDWKRESIKTVPPEDAHLAGDKYIWMKSKAYRDLREAKAL